MSDVLAVVLLLGLIGLHIFLTIWVFHDAKRKNRDAAVWCFAMLFYGLLAAAIYFLAGSESGKSSEYREPLSPRELRNSLRVFGTVGGIGVVLVFVGTLLPVSFGEGIGARTGVIGIGWVAVFVGALSVGIALLKLHTDLLSPCGRMGLGRYWLNLGPLTFVNILGDLILQHGDWSADFHSVVPLIVWGKAVPLSIFAAFQVIKRLHDLNLSGWYYCASAIPFYNIYLGLRLAFQSGTRGANRFGTEH